MWPGACGGKLNMLNSGLSHSLLEEMRNNVGLSSKVVMLLIVG